MFAILLAMSASPPDEELVQRFKKGDRQAFAQIVRRYQDRVYSQCLRWMGEPTVAEEVAQDVFLALYRSLARFRGEAALSTWIYRVTINHCKNRRLYRRRRARDRHEPLEGQPRDDAPGRQLAANGPESDVLTHQSEASALLQQGLEAISDDHRQVIILRDIQDLDYSEIASILELPRGTVKSRLHRARSELARVLRNRIGKEDVKP